MFDKRMVEMEKSIESLKRLLPFLMKKFLEHWYSLTAIIVDWDKSRVYLVHLGENVIQLDNWKEDRFTHMMAQLWQELEKKEALENLQEFVQEHIKATPHSNVIVEANTMTDKLW